MEINFAIINALKDKEVGAWIFSLDKLEGLDWKEASIAVTDEEYKNLEPEQLASIINSLLKSI